MQESPHYQPQRLEEFLLENNAMLQTVIHNQAYLMQYCGEILNLCMYQFTKKTLNEETALYNEVSRNAKEKLKEYKRLTSQIFSQNMEILKKWQAKNIQ